MFTFSVLFCFMVRIWWGILAWCLGQFMFTEHNPSLQGSTGVSTSLSNTKFCVRPSSNFKTLTIQLMEMCSLLYITVEFRNWEMKFQFMRRYVTISDRKVSSSKKIPSYFKKLCVIHKSPLECLILPFLPLTDAVFIEKMIPWRKEMEMNPVIQEGLGNVLCNGSNSYR